MPTIAPIDGIAQPSPIASDDPWKVEAAAYDWKIAGLHFNSAISGDNPMERAFSRVSKQAIDQSSQPGDQALDGWWIRSQTDWSGGAGYEFMEPISEDPIPKTFNWSYGINPWTPGKIYLHRKPSLCVTIALDTGATPVMTVCADTAGTDYLYLAVGTKVYRFLVENLKTVGYTVTTLGSPYCTLPSNVTSLVVAEGWLLACTKSDGVYRVQASPFRLFKSSVGNEISAWWAKDRLILAAGRHLYEQAFPNPLTLIDLDTVTPIVSQAETSWRWVSVTSGPRGILVAGRGTTSSSISLITLDTSGALPTLDAPFVVAEFPPNERVLQISAYLSKYLLISTTAGSRMAIIDADGTITYGPLLRTPYLNGKFSTFDRFAWSSVDDAGEGRSGLIRYDLSEVSGETRVAWATDLRIPSGVGKVVGQDILGQDYTAILSMNTAGTNCSLYICQPGSATEDYGIIQSGAIRMGATVSKNWARLNLSASPAMIGSIEAKVVTNEVVATIGTMSNPTYEIEWKIADEALSSQIAAVQLKLFKGAVDPDPVVAPDPTPTPTPGPEPGVGEQSWGTILAYTWDEIDGLWVRWDDLGGGPTTPDLPSPVTPTPEPSPVTPVPPTATPILESWAIRAVPAIERTELIRLPLLAFDDEVDTRGIPVGTKGSALARYKELISRVGEGRAVSMVNLNTGDADLVVIDDLSFKQTGKESRGSVFGGVIDLVARVL